MRSLDEAERDLIRLAENATLPTETIPVEQAYGRTLAEELLAPSDVPDAPRSTMDGYAFLWSALATSFEVVGEVAAGASAPHPTKSAPDAAVRIFTGARLPSWADTVVMQEDVERRGECIKLRDRHTLPEQGSNVRNKGAEVRQGAKVLTAGSALSPKHIALLLQCDRTSVKVARSPRVAFVSTGTELRLAGDSPGDRDSIPECSMIPLSEMVRREGGTIVRQQIVRDDLEATTLALTSLSANCDVIFTLGGVSVGDHDYIKPALEAGGAKTEFWKVAIKPGKPFLVATLPGPEGSRPTFVVGLPGNPVSSFVTMRFLGRPFLRALQARAAPLEIPYLLPLSAPCVHGLGRREFVRGSLGNDRVSVRPLPSQGSANVFSLAEADVFFEIREDVASIDAGTLVRCWPVDRPNV